MRGLTLHLCIFILYKYTIHTNTHIYLNEENCYLFCFTKYCSLFYIIGIMDFNKPESHTLMKLVFDDLTTKDEVLDFMETFGKAYVLKMVDNLKTELKYIRKSIVNGQKMIGAHGDIMERLEGTIVRFIHHDINVRILSLIILYDDKLKTLNKIYKEWEGFSVRDYSQLEDDDDINSLTCFEMYDEILNRDDEKK